MWNDDKIFSKNGQVIAAHLINETVQSGDYNLAAKTVTDRGIETIINLYNRLSPAYAIKYVEELQIKLQKQSQWSKGAKHDNLIKLFGALMNCYLFRKPLKEPISEDFKNILPDISKAIRENAMELMVIKCSQKKEDLFLQDSSIHARMPTERITGEVYKRFLANPVSWDDMFNIFGLKTGNLGKTYQIDDPDDPSSEFIFFLKNVSSFKDKPSQEYTYKIASESGFDELQKSLNKIYLDLDQHICALLKHPDAKSPDSSKALEKGKPKTVKCSFKWLKTPQELGKLHSGLLNHQLIKEIDFKDFEVIFSGQPVTEIETKIHWEKGQKLFAYFFSELTRLRFIPNIKTWIRLKYLFTYYSPTKGSIIPIPESFRTNVNKIAKDGPPKQKEIIDVIFDSIGSSTDSD